MLISRRSMLLGCGATAVTLALPMTAALAQAQPVPIPVDEALTRSARKYFLRHNPAMTKAQVQTALTAMNDNIAGPTGKSLLRRLAPLVVRRIPIVTAIEVIATGVGLWQVYDMIAGDTASPDYGRVTYVESGGNQRPSTYTWETGSSSSWSLKPDWYAWTYTSASKEQYDGSTVAGWDVRWLWNGTGQADYSDFDEATHLEPLLEPVPDAVVEEHIAAEPALALNPEAMKVILDEALRVGVAADPNAFPEPFVDPATRPGFSDADLDPLTETTIDGTTYSPPVAGGLLTISPATSPVFDPGSAVLDEPAPEPAPDAGGNTSGGGADCLPGAETCPAVVDWGDPPTDDNEDPVSPEALDWFPTPIDTPPIAGGQCPTFSIDVFGESQLIDFCTHLETYRTQWQQVAALSWTVTAASIVMDI